MSVARTAGFALASAAMVAGHGFVQGIVADGTYYGGYLVNNYPYNPSPPDVVGWSEQATDLGFVDGSSYTDPDIICHKNAENAAISATVTAGGEVELQWTEWPESHHGPVIDYLASCNGDCSTVDKTTLEWFKISESGLIDGSSSPGTWASDDLIANNNSWTVTIPSSIASGNYVLRHEIIALHSAGNENGAQNYPQCVNLEVTGGGSDSPSGTLGTELYTPTDEGILFNIYTTLDSYPIPGPALYSGGSSGGSGSGSAPTSSVPVIPTSSSGASSTPLAPSSTAPVAVPTTTAQVSVTATAPVETQVVQPTETATETAVATETVVETETAAPAPSATSNPSNPSTGSGSGSGSGSDSSSGSGSSEYPTDSDSLTSWFDSLSAEEFLSYLKATFSWLVADNKVHARALN
ncbi:glycosyl hydrolase family 61-domain-containing protein [Aspergillus undulatus]|uniref:glycosyl hydrolase family 61-domain-containing protein n=1 Tax=Aspergillus undulatus TaxID=1810928 RepID=UPI003CCDD9AD